MKRWGYKVRLKNLGLNNTEPQVAPEWAHRP